MVCVLANTWYGKVIDLMGIYGGIGCYQVGWNFYRNDWKSGENIVYMDMVVTMLAIYIICMSVIDAQLVIIIPIWKKALGVEEIKGL